METKVIMANINACIAPTNNSKNKNGNGIKYGAKNETIVSKTSPAKTFPNNRNDKEIILANSEISSKIPIKKSIGPLKFINLPMCLKVPIAVIPIIFVTKTEITANAKVKFKSAAGERKSGTSPNFNDPTPGNIPKRFEVKTNIKIVAINGKYFSAASIDPSVELISPNKPSTPISTAPCSFPGIVLILDLNTMANVIKIKDTTKVRNNPFVTLKLPMLNMCCAFKDISSIIK